MYRVSLEPGLQCPASALFDHLDDSGEICAIGRTSAPFGRIVRTVLQPPNITMAASFVTDPVDKVTDSPCRFAPLKKYPAPDREQGIEMNMAQGSTEQGYFN